MFSNFEIQMFYRYEHYMSISHIVLIVNMVHMVVNIFLESKSSFVFIYLNNWKPFFVILLIWY